MRKLKLIARKLNKLDNTDKFGLAFGLLFLLPSIIILLIDIFTNGAKML